jgi:hypothetical protein
MSHDQRSERQTLSGQTRARARRASSRRRRRRWLKLSGLVGPVLLALFSGFIVGAVAPVFTPAIRHMVYGKPLGPTEVRFFNPPSGEGREPGVDFVQFVHGATCYRAFSAVDPGAVEANLCLTPARQHVRQYFDPCWRSVLRRTVACFPNPWTRGRAIAIRVRRWRPRPDVNGSSRMPWALELTSGWYCVHLAGPTLSPIAGPRRTYVCDHSTAMAKQGAWVIGPPTGTPRAHVAVLDSGADRTHLEKIKVEWY